MILHTDSIKRSSAIYKLLQQTLISSLLDWNLQTSDNSCIFPRRLKHISLHHFYNNPNFFSLQSQRPTFTQISGKIIMEYFNLEAHCFCKHMLCYHKFIAHDTNVNKLSKPVHKFISISVCTWYTLYVYHDRISPGHL